MTNKIFTYKMGYVEYAFIALAIIAFIIANHLQRPIISYTIIFLFGLLFGRVWFKYKNRRKVDIFFIITGFIFGYILGQLEGSTTTAFALFILGIIIAYLMHDKDWIRSTEY